MRVLLFLACFLSCLWTLNAAPLAVPTTFACGRTRILNAAGNAYKYHTYCSWSQVEMQLQNDYGVYYYLATVDDLGNSTYKWTTNIPWILSQKSVTLKGHFRGQITGDEMFLLDLVADPAGWNKYIAFSNSLIAPMENAALLSGNAKFVYFFKYLPTSKPDLNLELTDTLDSIIATFFYHYEVSPNSVDPVYRAHLIIQILAWASHNGRTDVALHPYLQNVLSLCYVMVVSPHSQKARGYVQLNPFWDPWMQ